MKPRIDYINERIMLSECPEGYYGESCAEKCMCMNGATCDSETGSCICKTGWRGRLCGKGRIREKEWGQRENTSLN